LRLFQAFRAAVSADLPQDIGNVLNVLIDVSVIPQDIGNILNVLIDVSVIPQDIGNILNVLIDVSDL